MPPTLPDNELSPPRLLLVLPGAAEAAGSARTPLETASVPQLRALAQSGRATALQPVAPHLSADPATAAAALLGLVPPLPLDAGSVAAYAIGERLASDERCTVLRILDAAGRPAPLLEVERVIGALRLLPAWHRVIGVRAPHELLIGGVIAPRLPQVDGLVLETEPHGFVPARRLDASTVVVAERGSTLLGVAGLLGARTDPLDAAGEAPAERLRALREAATAALLRTRGTVIVEATTALEARRAGLTDGDALVRAALERLDRALIGPLATAAHWTAAAFAVTPGLACDARGGAVPGDVPCVLAAPRAAAVTPFTPLLAPLGTTPPPVYSEASLAALPRVRSPFTQLPAEPAGTSQPAPGAYAGFAYAVP